MPSIRHPIEVVYNGRVYKRYPDANQRAHRVYYVPTGSGQSQCEMLHRQVWIDNNGPIPKGSDIHHLDGDPFNNAPDNLVCITVKEHRGEHRDTSFGTTPEGREHLERIRAKAAEWHRSEEGRRWHSEHGKQIWEDREGETYVCRMCGEEFESRYALGSGYCSKKCRNAAIEHDPRNMVERICEFCKESFKASKYRKRRFCSTACRNRNIHAQRRSR